MIAQLRRWQLTLEIPHGISIGRTETGAWATSVLKEYPPALCGGLASGFLHSLSAHPISSDVGSDDEFRRRALSMIATPDGACIGPDFAH